MRPSKFIVSFVLLLIVVTSFPRQVHAVTGDQCNCANTSLECFADKATLQDAVDAHKAGTWNSSPGATTYGLITQWCTGLIDNMESLFYDYASFNEDISGWNTEAVTTMKFMFWKSTDFDKDISSWDVSSVEDMRNMFKEAATFNQDLTSWTTTSLTDTSYMFQDAIEFNGDISGWQMGGVTDTKYMFENASKFNRDLPWDVSNVQVMQHMFRFATIFNGNIEEWDTRNVGSMSWMFYEARAFNRDVSGWDLSSIHSMDRMFQGAHAFSQNLCSWRGDFAYEVSYEIFDDTNCADKGRPDATAKAPFCNDSTCVSAQPSSNPSDAPSDNQSESPSSEPSSNPSDAPSDNPSESPSSGPSSNPSVFPTKMPSESPSDIPSSDPSEGPSSEPSSEPSSTPSCLPSAYPTESPSTEFGVALYYPRWEKGSEGCFIDGNEPKYMAVNPTEWLSTTLQKCCKKYFSGYYYEQCLGKYPPAVGNCKNLLFYPDWSGSNEGCLADGQEPLYMLGNKDYFLSNSLEECCEKFYGWDFYKCTKTAPILTNGEYFPDWERDSSDHCTKEGEIPTYMLTNQKYYLSPTLEDCCDKHFNWAKRECMGSAATGTNKWYVVYGNESEETCLQDCVGSKPCGGLAPSWQSEALFDSQEKCCKEMLGWLSKKTCILNSRSN